MVFLLALLAILLVVGSASAAMGSIPIPVREVIAILLGFEKTEFARIVWEVRMPRIVAAALVGAGLSVCGTVMQSVLRNQLASPYTLGISSAAACGASFAIIFCNAGSSTTSSIIIHNPYIVSLSAFLFSVSAAIAILLLASFARVSAQGIVLAGVAIHSLFSAGLTLMQYLADSVQLANIISWTFGDLGRATWDIVSLVAVMLAVVMLLFFHQRWNFNALDTGEETAKSLGIHTQRVRITSMMAASLLSAVAVSFFGIISFIGLLGPHIAKKIVGGDHRCLILASPAVGAIVLVAADTAARTVLSPMVLPVGVLTSMLGGPLFIFLLIRKAGK